jgi:hypothetical protein
MAPDTTPNTPVVHPTTKRGKDDPGEVLFGDFELSEDETNDDE